MKTSEFMKRVAVLGYTLDKNKYSSIMLIYKGDDLVVAINTEQPYRIDSDYLRIQKELFELATEYVMTPVEDREGEPTYYLKSKIPKMSADRYLNWVKDEDRVTFLDKHSTPNFSSRLTKSGWEYATGCSWEELLVMFNVEPCEEEEE